MFFEAGGVAELLDFEGGGSIMSSGNCPYGQFPGNLPGRTGHKAGG